MNSNGTRFKIFLVIIVSNIFVILLTINSEEKEKVLPLKDNYGRFILILKTYFPYKNKEGKIEIGLTTKSGKTISKRAILHFPYLELKDLEDGTYPQFIVDIPDEDSVKLLTETEQHFIAYPPNVVSEKKIKNYEIIF